MLQQPAQQGFTILEILIYAGLLSMLLIGGWATMFVLIAATSKGTDNLHMQTDLDFVARKIHWIGIGARSVVVAGNEVAMLSAENSQSTLRLDADGLYMRTVGQEFEELLPSLPVELPEDGEPFMYNSANKVLTLSLIVNGEYVQRRILMY